MRVKEDGKSECQFVMNWIGTIVSSRKAAHFHLVCYHEEFVNAFKLEMTEDMDSRTPIIFKPTRHNASKAMPIQFEHWQLIDWEQANRIVKKLQRRIV